MLQYIFYVKNQNKKNLTFLWCFSACFINMVLQYLRQLHNLSSFFYHKSYALRPLLLYEWFISIIYYYHNEEEFQTFSLHN